jgi:hypothetical protein
MYFACIVKHRDDLRYADPGAEGTLAPAWEGASAEEAVPFDDSLFVGAIDGKLP